MSTSTPRPFRRLAGTLAGLTGLAGILAGAGIFAGPVVVTSAATRDIAVHDACRITNPHTRHCLAEVVRPSHPRGTTGNADGTIGGRTSHAATSTATTGSGVTPATLLGAYGFPAGGGAGKTIGIVDAYDDPNIASDLAIFSAKEGLPACTTANGCFTKVNSTGGTTYPAATAGWAGEISLDVEWAHALAPKAKILLVEASTATSTLTTAVVYAAAHSQYVSMSWGGSETASETGGDAEFANAPSVSFFAASGDTSEASGAIWPATSPRVVAVGGTSLNLNASGGFSSETAWSTAGGGCSAYEPAPVAQASYPTYNQKGATCAHLANGKAARATPDISLDGNPTTGVEVYDSIATTGFSGWEQIGGTSASTVMIAARAADAGTRFTPTTFYGTTVPIYNVTSGSNGAPCEKGYSLCAGLGSWNTAHGTRRSGGGTATKNLSITGAPTASPIGTTDGPLHVLATSPAPAGGLTVSVSVTADGQVSTRSTSGFGSRITLHIAAGSTTSPAFWFKPLRTGTATVSTSATGWSGGSHSITVTQRGSATGRVVQARAIASEFHM